MFRYSWTRSPNRVPRTVLSQHPVYCLLSDNCRAIVWTLWICLWPLLLSNRKGLCSSLKLITCREKLERLSKTHHDHGETCIWNSFLAHGSLQLWHSHISVATGGSCTLRSLPKAHLNLNPQLQMVFQLNLWAIAYVVAYTKVKPNSPGNFRQYFIFPAFLIWVLVKLLYLTSRSHARLFG